MGLFDFMAPDLSSYYLEGFILGAVIIGFFAGVYLLITGKGRILGILMAGGAAAYAFLSWG